MASGQRELDDGLAFFEHFEGRLTPEQLGGMNVFDLGCGYGGRTIFYAGYCGARHVTGIEISDVMIDRCEAFAEQRAVSNVTFQVAFAEQLPFSDEAFDAVLSYDVIEHVEDPGKALAEMARVMRPGATAWLVFPTYLGARASHLDYLTQLPLLHRIFDPDTIVDVVNEFLVAEPGRYGPDLQPRPELGPVGRLSLPTLNGMSHADALAAIEAAGLDVAWVRVAPLFTAAAPLPLAASASRALEALGRRNLLPDLFIGHLAFELVRR